MSNLLNLLIAATILGSVHSIDVVVQDLGCWTEKAELPLIESFEGTDELLDGPYKTRIDAIQKCAKVALKIGYRFFALRDGGLCATGPWVEQNYTVLGRSSDCKVKGYGGPLSNQVYMINTIFDARYTPLGCWDSDIEDLENLEGIFVRLMDDWQDREEAEEKCARAAASIGYDIFALFDNGCCFGYPKPQSDLFLYAPSKRCPLSGRGGPDSVNFYHVTERINVTIVDFGCWRSMLKDPIIPLIESRSDMLGRPDYKLRPDAVERCALYKADRNDGDVFAVIDGGACAASKLAPLLYDDLGPSDECMPDGRGSLNAQQVYKFMRKTKKIPHYLMEPYQPFLLNDLGCWKDAEYPLIPTLEGTESFLTEKAFEREDAVYLCAKAAFKRGYDVIAIREGKCFSSKSARKLFQTYGPSDECIGDLGGVDSISVFEVNTIIDPWYTNEGCFEKCDVRETFIPLENIIPLLQDPVRTRKDPIRKCSWVAAGLNYTYFGVRDGGKCYGVVKESIVDCVDSAACDYDGKGGRLAVQLYKIKVINNFTLENLGCWKDDAFRIIPSAEGSTLELSGRYDKREDAIAACARFAYSRGFKVFALQSGGMCMTSPTAEVVYNRYGWSNKCGLDGKGGVWSNQVWKIREDWWDSVTKWWDVPEPMSKVGSWKCTWQWFETPKAPLI